MAGTLGAGKTEFIEELMNISEKLFVHIDADKIKQWIPTYNGLNSHLLQGASALGT